MFSDSMRPHNSTCGYNPDKDENYRSNFANHESNVYTSDIW